MGFKEEEFSAKLNEVNNTQQSIETLSAYIIHHRKYSKKLVKLWKKQVLKVSQAKINKFDKYCKHAVTCSKVDFLNIRSSACVLVSACLSVVCVYACLCLPAGGVLVWVL